MAWYSFVRNVYSKYRWLTRMYLVNVLNDPFGPSTVTSAPTPQISISNSQNISDFSLQTIK